MSALTIGLEGSVVLSVFSAELENSGFLVPRTVPATAILFTEQPGTTSRLKIFSSKSFKNGPKECARPKLPIGEKVNIAHQKISPILNKISEPFTRIQDKFAMLKVTILDKLGLQCLVPRILHPLMPIMTYVKCALGLNNDKGFMDVNPHRNNSCSDLETQVTEINHHLEVPHFDITNLQVRTMDNCFSGMQKTVYGTRILTKLVNDESCEDQRYASLCEELFSQDRVIVEERCETPR